MIDNNELIKRINEFWKWFQDNSDRLLNFEENRKLVFDLLKKELCKVHPDLVFEFGPKSDSGWEFSVSADGILEVFPYVRAMVNMAPKFNNWKINAFRQRCNTDVILTFNDMSINTEDMKFKLHQDVDMVGITIYLPEFIDNKSDDAGSICCLMLDNALGEFDAITKVSFVEIENYNDSFLQKDVNPWSDLPQAFDSFYEKLTESEN